MNIAELTLFSNNIEGQKQFYKHVLKLNQILDTPNKIAFQVGKSILNFEFEI